MKVFPASSLSCFAWVSKTCLCSDAEPWWGGDHSRGAGRKSGTQEGRVPHPLSFHRPPLQGCSGPNSDVKAVPNRGSKREENTQEPWSLRGASLLLQKASFFLASPKCVEGEQSPSPMALWNCFPCRRGKVLQFSAFPSPRCPGLLGRVEENVSVENKE